MVYRIKLFNQMSIAVLIEEHCVGLLRIKCLFVCLFVRFVENNRGVENLLNVVRGALDKF